MDVVGLSFSVAQTILAALQCEELKDLFGSDLDGLRRSVETIQAVLLDAESKQAHGTELSAQERNFIEQIKDVVYDADDLLDAYLTRAKRQQIDMKSGHKLSAEVRGICSRLKHLVISSPKVEKIADKLENIGRDAQNFNLNPTHIRRTRKETCSYVIENDIIGREDDQRIIVDMLLQAIVQGEVPVLTIVGVGGLGKTSLAQLVYNDPKIQNEFSLRMWVCVSDEGEKQFDVKAILAQIYKSATYQSGDMELDTLVLKLRSKLNQHKYLLVLDDLWNEKRDECHDLVGFLRESVERGSRIVVTTRSKKTAMAIGSSQTYELNGLSEENSWDLFEKKVGREIKESDGLFEIGKDIVKKCFNVPLAIKVIGSLLYGADENEWLSFQQSKLFDIKKDDNDIVHILKLSYFHLSPSLKSCFTYCAIFPKDFEISKDMLISMWMAHDYVKDEAQAEEHFKILGQRSFFQDMEEKSYGKIGFKIHDLMHDMVQEVAGKEIYIANSATTELDKNIRHFYDGASGIRTKELVTPAKIRSYVYDRRPFHHRYFSTIQFPVNRVLAKWRHLRVLDLHNRGIIELPETIGDLLHLRYLDLSVNEQLRMPEALTKLINLQFLNLNRCGVLKELPRDFKRLVNLRTLYIPYALEYMPLGMNMTSLTRLNRFIVGHRKSGVKQEDMLKVLRDLTKNLMGSLDIWIKGDYKDAKEYSGEGGGYICKTQHLHSITIRWEPDGRNEEEVRAGNDEHLLGALQPHRNLKELTISGYNGVRIPRWAREDSLTTFLPNLVMIHLRDCEGLKELPWLGRLQHLKTLLLWGLEKVEYMENRRSIGDGSSSSSMDDGGVAASNSSTILFFPSLEILTLDCLPELKGWWSRTPAHPFPSFPRLSKLNISTCPNLISIPLCPSLETLELTKVNPKFGVRIEEEENSRSGFTKGGLPMVDLDIINDDEVESVSEFEVLRNCSSSIKSLKLEDCPKLRSVSEGGGLEYLTALEKLELLHLPELEFEENEDEMPWRSLVQSLRSLILYDMEKMDKLSKGMRYLTSLQSLQIHNISLLKEIPKWIECLSSLQSLKIQYCKSLKTLPKALKNLTSLNEFELHNCSDELQSRCEKPDGEYWPLLQHILAIDIQPRQRFQELNFNTGKVNIATKGTVSCSRDA